MNEVTKTLTERKAKLEILIVAVRKDIADNERQAQKFLADLAGYESALKQIDDFLAAHP